MDEVDQNKAEMAWLIYDLQHNQQQNRYTLTRNRTVYTSFNSALAKITTSDPGDIQNFVDQLQEKLYDKLENSASPDAPSLSDILSPDDLH